MAGSGGALNGRGNNAARRNWSLAGGAGAVARPARDDFADAARRDEARPGRHRVAQRGGHPRGAGRADGTSRRIGIALQLGEQDALEGRGAAVVGGFKEGNDQVARIAQRSAGVGVSQTPPGVRAARASSRTSTAGLAVAAGRRPASHNRASQAAPRRRAATIEAGHGRRVTRVAALVPIAACGDGSGRGRGRASQIGRRDTKPKRLRKPARGFPGASRMSSLIHCRITLPPFACLNPAAPAARRSTNILMARIALRRGRLLFAGSARGRRAGAAGDGV